MMETIKKDKDILRTFIVGGNSDDYIFEEEGPDVNMYLNYPEFISGSKVNDTICL